MLGLSLISFQVSYEISGMLKHPEHHYGLLRFRCFLFMLGSTLGFQHPLTSWNPALRNFKAVIALSCNVVKRLDKYKKMSTLGFIQQ